MAEIHKYRADRGMFLSKLAGLILMAIFIVAVALILPNAHISEEFAPETVWSFAGGAVAILVLLGVFAYLYYRSYRFWMAEDAVCSSTRLIYRREVVLPLAKIHTVNMRRNFFEILLGCTTVLADSGSVVGSMTEQFKVTLKKHAAEELYRYLKQAAEAAASGQSVPTFCFSDGAASRSEQEKKPPVFQMKKAGYFLCGATSGIFWLVVAAAAALIFVTVYVFPPDFPEWIFIAAVIGGLLICYLISVLCYALIYYGYRVYRNGEQIIIKYGSFTQKEFGLPVSKITMVTFYQNAIMQIVAKCSVRLQIIGYGASDGEKKLPPVLFLICGRKCAERMLGTLLPEFSDSLKLEKVTSKSAIHFLLLKNCLIFAAIIAVCIAGMLLADIAAPIFLIAIPVSVVTILLHSYLSYRNTAAACGKNCVRVRRGGLIRRETLLVKNAVQSVSIRSGPIRKKQKIGSIKISCYRNLFAKDVVIPYFQDSMFHAIVSMLMA